METKQRKKHPKDNQPTDFAIIFNMVFLVLIGLLILHSAPEAYEQFVAEDGPAEWIATISLLGCAAVCIERAIKLRAQTSKKFIVVNLLMASIFFLGVGEELSWGQRIFGIESSNFFIENNLQKETNFHNLKLSHLNVNKLIFGTIMGLFLFFYLFVLTFLYHRTKKVKSLVDSLGIPIPKFHHIIGMVIMGMIVKSIDAVDKWELMELAASMLFLAIFTYPVNKKEILLQ